MADSSVADLLSVKGKVILVTGGGRGIGNWITEIYVKNGAKVYISSRDAKACDAAAEELTKIGPGTCISIPEEGCKHLVDEIKKREDHLNVLVNNSGVAWGEDWKTYPNAAWDKLYNVNVKAAFFLIRECQPLLAKGATADNPSSIINIASVADVLSIASGLTVGAPFMIAYHLSKSSLIHMTKNLVTPLAADNIIINAICPGWFPTKMSKVILESNKEAMLETIPLRRFGRPQDIAPLALFLASKAAAYMSGSVISVDGGQATAVAKL